MIRVSLDDFIEFLRRDKTTPKMSREALKYVYDFLKNNGEKFNLLEITDNWNFFEVDKKSIDGDFEEYLEHLQKNGWAKKTWFGAVYQDNNKKWVKPALLANNAQRRAEKRKELQEQYAQNFENSNNN